MRIIAGTNKGGREDSEVDGLRPPSDKLRRPGQHSAEPPSPARLVLDVFSGTGRFALERSDRGASGATCVESDRRAAALIAENAELCRRNPVLLSATPWARLLKPLRADSVRHRGAGSAVPVRRISDAVANAAAQRAADGMVILGMPRRDPAATRRHHADPPRNLWRQRAGFYA